jgi:hypothetical protein
MLRVLSSVISSIKRGFHNYAMAVKSPRSELTDYDRIDMQIW